MNDDIDEKWIYIDRVYGGRGTRGHNIIVAISNTGKSKRLNGEITVISLRDRVTIDRDTLRSSRIIAENFLITVRRPDQTCIDHITHNPTDYNVNDVRNLRWCTKAENNAFEEARLNKSSSLTGDKHPAWKGDKVGPCGLYHRALKLYKSGKITEEEFQPYRDIRKEYRKTHNN